MKRLIPVIIILGLFAACKGEEEVPVPQEEVPKPNLTIKTMHEWPLAQGLVLVTSQPGQEAFAAMKANGIRTVINLRGAGEMLFDEATLAVANDLNYVHIPVRPELLSREQARDFARHLADPTAYPILVHCSSGNRAAMMMAIGEVQLNGTSPDAAIAKARERGMTQIDLEKTVQAMTLH